MSTPVVTNLSNITLTIDPRTDPLWDQLLHRHSSSVFHSPAWIQALTDTYGWDAKAHIVLDAEGQPCCGIPFCRISDILGERILALPFSDYCDPLVAEPSLSLHLLGGLLAENCSVSLRCLHTALPLADARFTLTKEAKWHGLDLQRPLDEIWNSIHDSSRRAIRKSRREGLQVRLASSESDLRAFFEMHLKIRKYKYGMLAQPYAFFKNIWRHFIERGCGFLLLAVLGDTILAGDLFLEWKNTLYYKFNASTFGELSHRPNDLLIWEGIQQAKARGLQYLDFGLSDLDQEGLLRFKRKFATEEKTISFLRHVPKGSTSPAEKEMRALLTTLTGRFTNQLVPDSITELAGEDLYRLFT